MFTPRSIVSTLTVVVATLSLNQINVRVGNVNTKFYIVLTLTVVVATLSLNQVKCEGWQYIYHVL